MPADGVPWLAQQSALTVEEMIRIARVAAHMGVRDVRLTGGEPLLHPQVTEIVRQLADIRSPDGPLDLSLTTNALRLPQLAADLKAAGLSRINISLDTLQADRFVDLTRRDRLADTLAGIEAARQAGFAPIKLNALIMRGVNEDEITDLVHFAAERGLHMRFIEHMPLDAGHTWDRAQMVTRDEILTALAREFSLTPVDGRGASPAEEFTVDGSGVTVGVIASVTQPFCDRCDRVRLTSDGQFRNCLFAHEESDLRTLLRTGADDDALASAMRASVAAKRRGHGIGEPGFTQPERPMSAIGG
jgi:cyclic pyranopterin phosphate synthase